MKLKRAIMKTSHSLYFFCIVLFLHSCGFVHFSNTQLPEGVDTFSIHVQSEILDGPSDIAQNMADTLEENIIRFVPYLTKVEQDGAIHYNCVIKSFAWRTTFTRDETFSNKAIEELTITVQVSYESSIKEVHTFSSKNFSKSKTSDNSAAEENNLVNEIIKELVTSICDRSINYWE